MNSSKPILLFRSLFLKDTEAATDSAINDPFVVEEVMEDKWLKEWIRK
jgi:uncharacterized protein YciI